MRLLDQDNDKPLARVMLYLTRNEGLELLRDLERLLNKPSDHHSHIDSDDWSKEVTIAIYDPNNLRGFDERSKRLILEDV